MAKRAYLAIEKYELIVAFEDRQTSIRDFCRQFNISKGTVNKKGGENRKEALKDTTCSREYIEQGFPTLL